MANIQGERTFCGASMDDGESTFWVKLDKLKVSTCVRFRTHRDQTTGGLGWLSLIAKP